MRHWTVHQQSLLTWCLLAVFHTNMFLPALQMKFSWPSVMLCSNLAANWAMSCQQEGHWSFKMLISWEAFKMHLHKPYLHTKQICFLLFCQNLLVVTKTKNSNCHERSWSETKSGNFSIHLDKTAWNGVGCSAYWGSLKPLLNVFNFWTCASQNELQKITSESFMTLKMTPFSSINFDKFSRF